MKVAILNRTIRLISHRGNLQGPCPERENSPEYIDEALDKGYEVEVDIWKIGKDWYLGHDIPDYPIPFSFLEERKFNLWCHAKNIEALKEATYQSLNAFWHTEEDYVLTTKQYILVYPGRPLIEGSVVVLPETTTYNLLDISVCEAVCTDTPEQYIRLFKTL